MKKSIFSLKCMDKFTYIYIITKLHWMWTLLQLLQLKQIIVLSQTLTLSLHYRLQCNHFFHCVTIQSQRIGCLDEKLLQCTQQPAAIFCKLLMLCDPTNQNLLLQTCIHFSMSHATTLDVNNANISSWCAMLETYCRFSSQQNSTMDF